LPGDAVNHFEKATEIAPQHLRFLSKLADAQSQAGDISAAIQTYDTLIGLNPKFEAAYNNRGFARLQTRDIGGAESDFRHSLSLYPDGVNALANLASLMYNTGRVDSALVMVDRLLVIDPSNEEYREFRRIIAEREN
jgi:tetratricopeptide (TPR) repeat protein